MKLLSHFLFSPHWLALRFLSEPSFLFLSSSFFFFSLHGLAQTFTGGLPSFAQSITFRHTFGGENHDHGRSVKQTFDGGYIVAGSTSSFGYGNSDVYLIKSDSLGVKQWSNVYGGANVDWGYSVVQTPDSSYVICGCTNSFGSGGYDVYLIKVDSIGNLLWQKTFGGTDWDFAYTLQNTLDGGFIIAGETYSYGSGNNDVYLIKTNSNGDETWTKTYGGGNIDYGKSVKQTFDGGYILAGGTSSFGAGMTNVYMVRTNNIGDTLWTKTFGGDSMDFANSIIQTSDSGFAIAGSTKSFNDGDFDYYIIKTDTIGNEIWNQTYSSLAEDDEAKEIIELPTSYGFSGFTKSAGFIGNKDFHLVITDLDGWVIFGHTWGTDNDDEAFALVHTTDNGFILGGYTSGEGVGFSDVLLIKVDSLGEPLLMPTINIFDSVVVITSLINNQDFYFSISPNPFNDKSLVVINNYFLSNFVIYNSIGEKVRQYDKFSNKLEINRENLNSGIYFFQLSNADYRYVMGKLIIF